MSAVDLHDRDHTAAEARDWVYRLADAEGSDTGEACLRWRSKHPENETAFQLAWQTWRAVAQTRAAGDQSWRQELSAIKQGEPAPRWFAARAVRFGIPAALAASIAALFLAPQLVSRADSTIATRTGENRLVALADGTRLTLGAQSGIAIRLRPERREITLDRGQAFFEVAHDPTRPFIVFAGNAEIRVTGTKFDVRRVGGDVEVSVLEGRVEVLRRPLIPLLASRSKPEHVLTAGEQSDLTTQAGHFGEQHKSPITPGEWRTGRLFYADAPLAEIVADANRYNKIPVRIAADAIGDMRLTASFRAGDVGGFVQNIEATLPLRAQRTSEGAVLLVAR